MGVGGAEVTEPGRDDREAGITVSDERLHGALFGESERGAIVLARGVHLRRGSAEGDGAEQAQGRGLEAALAALARDNQCPGGALAAASGVTTEHVRFAELRKQM